MNRAIPVGMTCWLLLVSLVVPAIGLAGASEVRITDITYTGAGDVSVSGDELVLWQSDAHEITVTVFTATRVSGEACLVVTPVGTPPGEPIACTPVSAPADRFVTVLIGVEPWPADLRGPQSLSIAVTSPDGSTLLAHQPFPVTVIRAADDLDGDGLSNTREVSLGTDFRAPDTDGDRLVDGVEVETHGTSPTSSDSDGDGLSDFAEIQTHRTSPVDADTDNDGLPDDREVTLGTNPLAVDSDGDGQLDGAEVTVYSTDPLSPDTDGDGLDDDAEITDYQTNPLQSDTDGDGLSDDLEINTYGTDPTRVDSDRDGLQDGEEVEVYQTDPTTADSDGDGLGDGEEVTRYGTSPTAADTDGDGLSDRAEVARFGTNPNAIDSDNDGTTDDMEVEVQGVGTGSPPTTAIVGMILVGLTGIGYLYRSGRLPGRAFGRSPGSESGGADAEPPADPDVPDAIDRIPPPGEAEATIPPEFLSNDDRVMTMLDDNGGKMRQAEIVDQTEWSKSTVSRVLSSMAEEGQIVKIDVGRGNVVTRPENVPEGALQPFDE